MPELRDAKLLKKVAEAFDLHPTKLINNGNLLGIDERIARAAYIYASRYGLGNYHKDCAGSIGYVESVSYKEIRWLSSFMLSTHTVKLHKKVMDLVLEAKIIAQKEKENDC
jgi:hypothetical protein